MYIIVYIYSYNIHIYDYICSYIYISIHIYIYIVGDVDLYMDLFSYRELFHFLFLTHFGFPDATPKLRFGKDSPRTHGLRFLAANGLIGGKKCRSYRSFKWCFSAGSTHLGIGYKLCIVMLKP